MRTEKGEALKNQPGVPGARIPCIPTHRGQIKHSVLTLLIASALAAGAAQTDRTKRELLRVEGSVDAMGTGFSIVAYGENRVRLQSGVAQGLEEARRPDQMPTNYKPDSEWSQMNRQAADGPVHITAELFQLLAACVE